MSAVAHGPWQQRDAAPIGQFRPFSPSDWQGKAAPALDWIVEGCFLRGTVAMLSGDGGLGKSLLMQQLCTAAATGRSWLGLRTKQCRAFALFCEDDAHELHRRQMRINAHYGIESGDLTEVMYASRAGEDSILMRFDKWGQQGTPTPLFDQLTHACRQLGAEIIIIDTLADVFSGNEIDRNQPRTFVRALRRLAMACQGVVILTQHPSLQGLSSGSGLSGSTGWNNSVRSRLYLTSDKKAEDDTVRELKTMKSNSGPTGNKLKLRWCNGVFQVDEPPAARHYSDPDQAEWPL